jgi:glucokinase
MTTSAGISLLGDIGATNARFALLADGVLSAVRRVEVRHYPHFFDAIEVFLKEESLAAVATRALFAVAGPVKGDRFKFTNCSWTIDSQEMQSRFDFQAVRIINDFEATALSLPHLLAKDVLPLGGGHAVAGAPMVVLEHLSIRLGVSRVREISVAFFFGNTFEKRGDCSPKLLNSARLHFA